MRKKLLLLMLPLMGAFLTYSQAELTVVAPNGIATTGLRAPNGTAAHTSVRGVIIVSAAELSAIPSGTIISKLGFILSAGATPGPAGGNIKFYLENTADATNLKSTNWATAISTMTNVYDGAYSIPAVAGPTADLILSSGFTYTGGAVYVAYDYLGATFSTVAGVYNADNTLAGGWKGDVSATTTPPATLTQSSAFRPNIRFTFANPFTNEMNVTGLAGEKGIFNNTIKTSQTVTSIISNTSVGALTNVPVTLTVTGANPFSITQTVPSIAAGGSSTVLFNNVPTINLGAQTLTVTIPADEQPGNNSRTFTQLVQCDTIGYAQSPVQSGGVGFNTGAGLIAVRHIIPNTIETYVKSVSNYFPIAASNAGNTVKGILLDGNGTILDSTALITITAGMLGTKQNFDFINGAINVAGSTIYVGFRQTANATTGYFPFANQNNSYVDPNAAATFPLFGGAAAPLGSGLGYMMIDATLTYGTFNVANTSTNGTVCANSTLGILPTTGYTNYEFFVDGGSVQNGSTPTYTTGPISTPITYNVNITNGTCILNSAVQNITVVTALINNISAGICPGDSYTVGTSTYSTSGIYADTLSSSNGCDSIVNLTLSDLVPTVGSLNVSICQGETYSFGGQFLSMAGSYNDTIPNAAGCDSVITLNLAVNSPSSSTLNLTVCGTSYQFGNQNITTSGMYTRTIPNAAGCDSVITLNLMLNAPIAVTTSLSGATITATATPAATSYSWIDCATNTTINGQTSATFTATTNGNYAVVVINTNGCTDTSACVAVLSVGLDELKLLESVNVYPNPVVGELHIVSTSAEIMNFTVLDAKGRVVYAQSAANNTKELVFSTESFDSGMYIIELNTTQGKIFKSVVKK